MSERERALSEFDSQHDIPARVSLSSVDIPFWDMVNLILKFQFATIVASFIIGAIIGLFYAAYLLTTS